MPIYHYKCSECGKEADEYNKINDRKDNAPKCHGKMALVIIPPQIAPVLGGGSIPGYKCPVTGKFVTSRKERREIMKRNNLVEKG